MEPKAGTGGSATGTTDADIEKGSQQNILCFLRSGEIYTDIHPTPKFTLFGKENEGAGLQELLVRSRDSPHIQVLK